MLNVGVLLASIISFYSWVVLIYVLLSWIPNKRGILEDINALLGKLVDPFLNIFRPIMRPIGGMVDITPVIAILVLQLASSIVVRLF